MLDEYLNRTRRLLQNPPAPTSLYSTADLTSYINIARGQIAGEAQCIRRLGTISTVIGQRVYKFDDIDVGVAATTGVQDVIHVRELQFQIASGQKWITPRPWEWFSFYAIGNPVPTSGQPQSWSQYGQGASAGVMGVEAGGTFYVDPIPDDEFVLVADCVCYPIKLVNDASHEALPYFWIDAVPFFAAYLAYLSAQAGARQADAERMFSHYSTFMQRARQFANPSLLNWQYSQSTDQVNKLGAKAGGG